MSTDYLAPNVRDALDIAYATVRARRPDTGGTLATLKAAKAANDDRAAAIVTFLADCEVREYTDTDVALAMLAELYAHLTGETSTNAVGAARARMLRDSWAAGYVEPDPDDLLDQQNDRDAEGG